MIKSIKGVSLRFFHRNKFIAISSIISVILSVSLIITLAIFSINAKQTLHNEVKKMYGNMDLSVGYNPDQNKIVDRALLQRITNQPGIQSYSNVVLTHLSINHTYNDIYTVGVENDSLVKSKYHFHQDLSANEAMINKSLAEALKVRAGEKITIENETFKIKELLDNLDASGVAPDILLISRDDAKKFIAAEAGNLIEATYILIKAKKSENPIVLANDIRKVDRGLRIDLAEENEYLKTNLTSLQIFMTVLSVLMLFVTSLLIVANFEVFLYKYKNQFAIMRSLGATSKQMFNIVFIQSSLMVMVGAVLGFLLAFLSNQFIQNCIQKWFAIHVDTMDFHPKLALLLTFSCFVLIEIFMLIPAYRSSKVLPLKIMQENERNDFANTKFRKVIGYSMIIGGLFFILFGKLVVQGDTYQVFSVLFAGILITFGIFVLFPIYLAPFLHKLLPLIRSILGRTSFVSIKNVTPQVRKNTFVMLTISTLMIITIFGSTLMETIKKNQEQYLKNEYQTNIVVTSRLNYDSKLDPMEIKKQIVKLSGIKGASTVSTPTQLDLIKADNYYSFDYFLGDLKELASQGLISKNIKFGKNQLIVSRNFAKKFKVKAGDTIRLGNFFEAEQKQKPIGKARIAAIVDKLPLSFDVMMDWSSKYRNQHTALDRVFISSDNEKYTLKQLEALKMNYPELEINSYQQSLKKANKMFDQRLYIFYAVIAIMVVCVMVGVFNTLINNIHSKRKEFAILRTLSINKRGVIIVIMTQVILYILIGIALGSLAGTALTYVISLIDTGSRLHFNFPFIGIIMAILIGMAIVVFVPFASKLAKVKISTELSLDNK